MTVATGTRTMSSMVTLATDTGNRWTAYSGTAPETAAAPFVSIYLDTPMMGGIAQCFDDFGAIRSRWRINLFAASMDQARWLQGEIVAKSWPNMILEQVGPVTLDPTEQPDLYMCTVVFRDYQVTDR